MVGLGLTMVATVVASMWPRKRGRLFDSDWFLRPCMLISPLGFVGVLAALVVVSVWTPLMNVDVASRWFSRPNVALVAGADSSPLWSPAPNGGRLPARLKSGHSPARSACSRFPTLASPSVFGR
jgi:hypothetical protein